MADDAPRSEGPLGPLAGLRIVELASSRACFAGKLFAIYGAEVIVVEPPGGHETRRWAPFAGDIEDPERSLWWWHYNTNKLGVTLDLDDNGDAVAAHVKPVKLDGTKLIVEVDDPAWATQLRFLETTLKQRLLEVAGATIESVEVRVKGR